MKMSQKILMLILGLTCIGNANAQSVSSPAAQDKSIPISQNSKAAVASKTSSASNNPDVRSGADKGISATINAPEQPKEDPKTQPFISPDSKQVVK